VFHFFQGEPGATGLRGPEGATGIGTQGEKVLHSLIFLIFNGFLSIWASCNGHLVDVKRVSHVIIITYSMCWLIFYVVILIGRSGPTWHSGVARFSWHKWPLRSKGENIYKKGTKYKYGMWGKLHDFFFFLAPSLQNQSLFEVTV